MSTATSTVVTPVPEPAPPSGVQRPGRRTKILRWSLAGAAVAILALELGPWPGVITRALGLAVGPSGGTPSVPVGPEGVESPAAEYRRRGSRIVFDDDEMALLAGHLKVVWHKVGLYQNQRGDFAIIQQQYRGLVPQLYDLVEKEQFPEENARRWARFVGRTPPSRHAPPFDFEPLKEDLALAVVTRQVTTGQLSDVLKVIRWRQEALQEIDRYRDDVAEVGRFLPPELHMAKSLPSNLVLGFGTGLQEQEDFIQAKLARGDAPLPKRQPPPPAATKPPADPPAAPAKQDEPAKKPEDAAPSAGTGTGTVAPPAMPEEVRKQLEEKLKKLKEPKPPGGGGGTGG